jgi:hypothetical protein
MMMQIVVLGKSLSTPRYPRSKHINNLFRGYRMVILVNIIAMPSSFLMVCLMKDMATIVNHKLILGSMSFLLFARIVCLTLLLLSTGLGICCSGQSMKDRKPEKYCSTSCRV